MSPTFQVKAYNILIRDRKKNILTFVGFTQAREIAHQLCWSLSGLQYKNETLNQKQFDILIQKLEVFARKQPSTYKLRVALLATLGYIYIVAILAATLAFSKIKAA